MALITLKHVYKNYTIDRNKKVNVLNDISLSFPSSGFIAINGASGSGKSTLLNLIALFDKPSKGEIKIKGFGDLNKKKNAYLYHNQIIGVLFQNYNLIEDESVVYNIALPLIIKGEKEKYAFKEAKILLKKINFPSPYYDKKVSLLSGGEKQRVALLRSLINAPYILLCDEPTGAVDSENSKLIMEILKKVSLSRLVILVSHNDELVKQYADRIITIQDGKIIKDIVLKQENAGTPIPKLKRKSNKFNHHFMIKNIKKRHKRAIFSFFSLSISFISTFLVIGFINGAKSSLHNAYLKQFDIGTSSVYKESITQIAGSSLSLNKVSRLNHEELKQYELRHSNFVFADNYSYFVPSSLDISYQDLMIENGMYSPIYSFNGTFINEGNVLMGSLPKKDDLNEVVINKKMYEEILKIDSDPLYTYFNLFYKTSSSYYLETGYEIKDEFIFNKKVLISGVVDDLNFLSTPKIYYSYKGLIDYLYTYPLNNLSAYFNQEVSIAERVNETYDNDAITSYSHYMFLNDVNDYEDIENDENKNNENIVFENQAYTKYKTLINLADVISIALTIFLIIAIIGSILINGIITFASFSEDLKDSAILSCLGAGDDEIASIYVFENFILSLLSLFFSMLASYGLQYLLNFFIARYTYFSSVINIPFLLYQDKKFIVPLFSLLAVSFISFISSYLPISFTKRISIAKELKSND